jgi:hypothetical protein
MISRIKLAVQQRWEAFTQTPFGCLQRLLIGRVFHGGGDSDPEGLELGTGAIIVLLTLPGALASLLMFDKYGSLFHYLMGVQHFDPFRAAVSDEYFFIVLSVVVAGAAALWRWDSIFPDRRDYINLVPLPITLRSIFVANLFAILLVAVTFTVVVNFASLFLFPAAVMGGEGNGAVVLRFAAGHAAAVLLASAFSCSAVFALVGVLMSVLPAVTFKRVSLVARFLIAVVLLGLLASSVAVPHAIQQMSISRLHRVELVPPVCFLGVAETIWGRGGDAASLMMARVAIGALAGAILTAILAYVISFRRSFLRIPEMPDSGPLPRPAISWSPLRPALSQILRTPPQRAVYWFAVRALTRSEGHLQIVLGFLALGVVAAVSVLASAANPQLILTGAMPPLAFLAVPYALSYCVIIGVRFAFEMPANLKANWIFQYFLDRNRPEAREIARRVLLVSSLSWIAPATFLVTAYYWGLKIAMLHTAALILCTAALVEALLANYRKVPFTCTPPTFKRNAGLVALGYVFGFFLFSNYLSQLDAWSLVHSWRAAWFILLPASVIAAVHFYRKQMLEMDKDLIFEEVAASEF